MSVTITTPWTAKTTPATPAPTTPAVATPASNVVPFSMPWGSAPFPPGCCPPGGMDALMQCYCDIQQTLAFMSKIMVQLMTTDPAVQAAMVAGIQESGSSVPLIGVTNGSAAQPGQVGEQIQIIQAVNYPATGLSMASVTMGVLQPGDWLVWASMGTTTLVGGTFMVLNPQPVGFNTTFAQELAGTAMGAATALVSNPGQALISVPTLVALNINVTPQASGQVAGIAEVFFSALRVR